MGVYCSIVQFSFEPGDDGWLSFFIASVWIRRRFQKIVFVCIAGL